MMQGGPIAAIGLGIAALLAFFWGEDDASASEKPGGGVISPDDALGAAEAEKLASMIDDALDQCPPESLSGEGYATDKYGEIPPCNYASVRVGAKNIRNYPWKHPEVEKQAMAQADWLDAYADDAQKIVAANVNAEKEAEVLAKYMQGVCNVPTQACATQLYSTAKKIKSYPWKSQVGQAAWNQALSLEGAAKAIEDSLKA